MEAAGVEPARGIENAQVADFTNSLKRQNRQKRRTEVHGGYTKSCDNSWTAFRRVPTPQNRRGAGVKTRRREVGKSRNLEPRNGPFFAKALPPQNRR